MAKYFLIFINFALLIGVKYTDGIHEHLYPKLIPRPRSDQTMGKVFGDRAIGPKEELNSSFWIDKSQIAIQKLLKSENLPVKAKNIILFIGDGMSIPTLAAARIVKGQNLGTVGESSSLSFENFPYTGLSKTYCVDAQVPDSACTATAYLSGIKTNFFALGVNANTNIYNCSSAMDPANHVDSIATWAQKAGKATGIVTTTTVTHASPGGTYAHIANRLYESDSDCQSFNEDPTTCQDIASQLINNSPGNNFNVIMGGGRLKFLPTTTNDHVSKKPGQRLDGVNLINKWKKQNKNGVYVTNKDELQNINLKTTSKILGLFNPLHLDFNLLRNKTTQPSLEEMTESAINLLSKDPEGYFLFVEGGLIDHGHHNTEARLAIDETLEFEKAIEKARSMTNPLDTLIVVTSDHSHTMSIPGYPSRNNDILGIDDFNLGKDGIPYFTLNYANGPKQYLNINGERLSIPKEEVQSPTFKYPSFVPLDAETHGGDDVAVFASGPYGHFFTGVYEQNDIPHKMAFAACIGDGLTHCDSKLN